MVEKKNSNLVQKKIEEEQLKLWNEENTLHFNKEKELNEKVYF